MLKDLLAHNLKLVVCGTAVGDTSARLKQYYAKPSNKFWKMLHQVALTPVRLSPLEHKRLLEYSIGLTDLVKDKSGMDTGLVASDFGNAALEEKMQVYQPCYLCFNGKRAAKEFLQRRVDYGLQPERIGVTRIFVAPSTSGAANRWWNIEHWRQLARLYSTPINDNKVSE